MLDLSHNALGESPDADAAVSALAVLIGGGDAADGGCKALASLSLVPRCSASHFLALTLAHTRAHLDQHTGVQQV